MKKLLDEDLFMQEEDTKKVKFLTFSLGNEFYDMEIEYVTEIIDIQPITEVPQLSGYTVVVAGNETDTLDKLNKSLYDVVLMDVGMPEMDGVEEAKIIRENEKETSRHIPIVALTAHAIRG